MRPALLSPLVFLISCTVADEPPGDSVADSASPQDTAAPFDTGVYDQLNGALPDEPLGLPVFEATAQNGELRSQEHLLGHPSVIWFYPLANTSG